MNIIVMIILGGNVYFWSWLYQKQTDPGKDISKKDMWLWICLISGYISSVAIARVFFEETGTAFVTGLALTTLLYLLFTKKVFKEFKSIYKYSLTILFVPIVTMTFGGAIFLLIMTGEWEYVIMYFSPVWVDWVKYNQPVFENLMGKYADSGVVMLLVSLFADRKSWAYVIQKMKK